MPRLVRNSTVGASSRPPSIFTAEQPVSFIRRAALRNACSVDFLVGAERQVDHQARMLRAAPDSGAVHHHHVEGDGQRAFETVDHHAEGIADQQQVDMGIERPRHRRGVGGQADDLVLALARHQVGNADPGQPGAGRLRLAFRRTAIVNAHAQLRLIIRRGAIFHRIAAVHNRNRDAPRPLPLAPRKPLRTPDNGSLPSMTDDLRVRGALPGWGALALILGGLLAACATPPEPILTDSGPAGAAEATGRHFMVATADPAASEAALAILRQGGSAVDAAIAAQAVLGLVEPQSSGIGGGAFLLHWDGVTRKLSALDGRETAPKNARPDLFLDEDGKPVDFLDAALSGRSVGVPGVLRVLELAHRREGRLPWADLFQPAIDAGGDRLRAAAAAGARHRRGSAPQGRSGGARLFLRCRRQSAPRRHDPAQSGLRRDIARDRSTRGADAFYGGPIAQAILAEVNDDGIQHMSAMDLVDYRARERDVLCRPYRAYAVCSMGPPTSGGIALLQILGILRNFDLAPLDPDGAPALHLIAEASRLAFADRDRYVADADFARVPTAKLLEASYLKARAGQIRSDRSLGEARPGKFTDPMIVAEASQRQLEPQSTTHFVIVDSAGDIVSMTSSIEMGFGSHRMVGGFLLNNELTDFSFLPAAGGRLVANRIEPGKRPRSSMTPAIVFDQDNNPVIALGSPGGPNIIGYVAQALIEMIDWGRSPGAGRGGAAHPQPQRPDPGRGRHPRTRSARRAGSPRPRGRGTRS